MELISKKQIKLLHTLLSHAGLMDSKRDIILHVTKGRTDSARELTSRECERIVAMLKPHDSVDKMRKKIFYVAHQLGIVQGTSAEDRVINRHVLDQYLVKRSYLHKPLAKYSRAELPKLVTQMMMILKHTNEGEAKKSVGSMLDELDLKVEQ